jgi:hypothetical protein
VWLTKPNATTRAATLRARCSPPTRANPRQVTVWSFRGYATKDVVGVRFDNADSFGVFVADDVPQAGSDRIYAELGKRQR